MKHVLGLDVGNAKVKVLYLQVSQGQALRVHWDSLPLPMSAHRPNDFKLYLPLQILQFLKRHGIETHTLDQVVTCCSHSFGYDPYSESVKHLADILQGIFKVVPVSLVRCDGELTPVEEISALSESALYGYVFTNFYGSAWLGKSLIQKGLSLDMGTTTLDVIPIVNGAVDPEGLKNPENYLRFRYHQQRIHWLGMTITPLEAIAREVTCGGESYQIVPRGYSTESLFATGHASQRELLTQHAYGKKFPLPEKARRDLCESIGLDNTLLTDDEVEEVRQSYYNALVKRVTEAIQQVAHRVFPETPVSELELAVFALGAEAVLRPALEKAGFNTTRIQTLQYGHDQQLWSASSVFSMALQALNTIGEPLHWH